MSIVKDIFIELDEEEILRLLSSRKGISRKKRQASKYLLEQIREVMKSALGIIKPIGMYDIFDSSSKALKSLDISLPFSAMDMIGGPLITPGSSLGSAPVAGMMSVGEFELPGKISAKKERQIRTIRIQNQIIVFIQP